jgi:alkylation response protein AidB-like acyl-CoA dehydrogenase
MNLEPSELQRSIADAAADLLGRVMPARLAAIREGGPESGAAEIDEVTWAHFAEMGWFKMTLPEGSAGLGLGLAEEVMLFREIGRFLAPGPIAWSALATRVAEGAGNAELASRIAAGEQRVGLAADSIGLDVSDGGLALRLRVDGADLVGVRVVGRRKAVDPCVDLADVEITAELASFSDPLVLARARVLLAAQCLGIIEAVRDQSAEYARTRQQFGRPIGTFQAVKHRCADMVITEASTTGQVFQAALYVEDEHPDAAFHAAIGYLLAVRGAARCATDNIQNHGGIGFSWEHEAHLYLKRALVLENALGPIGNTYEDILVPERHEFR